MSAPTGLDTSFSNFFGLASGDRHSGDSRCPFCLSLLACPAFVVQASRLHAAMLNEAGATPAPQLGASRDSVMLIGDQSDPWVGLIGDCLSAAAGVTRLDCRDELPDRPLESGRVPRVIVVHRNRLSPRDARRIAGWRGQAGAVESPLIVVCVSPYVRYEELERSQGIADLVMPEATAPDILPGRLARLAANQVRRRRAVRRRRFRSRSRRRIMPWA